jgi:hypothetical protein
MTRSFVLFEPASLVCLSGWVWSIGGMVLTRVNKHNRRKRVSVHSVSYKSYMDWPITETGPRR